MHCLLCRQLQQAPSVDDQGQDRDVSAHEQQEVRIQFAICACLVIQVYSINMFTTNDTQKFKNV